LIALLLGMILIGVSVYVGGHWEGLGARKLGDTAALLKMTSAKHNEATTNPVMAEDDEEDSTFDTEQSVEGASSTMLQQLFAKIDENRSGFIERGEVAVLARALGLTLNKGELDAAMVEMDENGDGCIDSTEFEQWFQTHEQHGLFPALKLSFATTVATAERFLRGGVAMSLQPLKIFVSYWRAPWDEKLFLTHCTPGSFIQNP
jgi:hypothetical protein